MVGGREACALGLVFDITTLGNALLRAIDEPLMGSARDRLGPSSRFTLRPQHSEICSDVHLQRNR